MLQYVEFFMAGVFASQGAVPLGIPQESDFAPRAAE
jgi:hypothetical protein